MKLTRLTWGYEDIRQKRKEAFCDKEGAFFFRGGELLAEGSSSPRYQFLLVVVVMVIVVVDVVVARIEMSRAVIR